MYEIDDVFTKDECKQAIAAAEAHAAAHGWDKKRHIAHQTTDLAVDSVPALGFVTAAVTDTPISMPRMYLFSICGRLSLGCWHKCPSYF